MDGGAALRPGEILVDDLVRRLEHAGDDQIAQDDEHGAHQRRGDDDGGHAQSERHGRGAPAFVQGAGSSGMRSFPRWERWSSISRKSVAGATVLTGT
jgi:hypothetical protein